MRVLVIGGTRFIGAATVRRLVALGHEVAVFHRGKTAGELPDAVTHLHGDRDALRAHREALLGFAPEVVLHNIVLHAGHVTDLLDVVRPLAPRIVLVSSMDVYRAYGWILGLEEGDPDPLPLDEDSPLRASRHPYRARVPGPEHPHYDYDKIPAEQALLAAPLPSVVLRLPMVLGPGDVQHRLWPYLGPLLEGRPVELEPAYASWRSTFGYVDNVADAIALACTDPRFQGVLNVADQDRSMAEIAADVAAAIGFEGVVLRTGGAPEPGHDFRQSLVVRAERLRALGWRPEVPWDEAIRRTVAWESAHPPEP